MHRRLTASTVACVVAVAAFAALMLMLIRGAVELALMFARFDVGAVLPSF